NALGRWILGPAGCQLGTGPEELCAQLPRVDFELGVIAGDRSINPFLAHFIKTPNDGKVSIASARVKNMTDFTVVPFSHTWLVCHETTRRQTASFLRDGHLDRQR